MSIARDGAKLLVESEPVSWLGANFWSRTGGPLMWRSYDPTVVRSELATLHAAGLRQSRSFFYWPDFHPEPHRIDNELVARFGDFLDAHVETGMTSIPTFIVGHMSGENWNPAWRGDRDLYADVWLVGRQAWFIEQMVRAFARHPAVAGWLISNEMPIYGRHRDQPAAPTEQVSAWATLMVQAVRAGGGQQPVSLGDGAWGIEVTGKDNGFSVREIAQLVDFIGPHVYPMAGTDPIRQHLAAAFACELSAVGGKPVVLEEFGLSSDIVSAAHQGHFYRQTLHLSLLAGATGWLAWNNTDYDHLYDQDPYRHHPFEMHFGITTNTGQPKPALNELAAFAETLERVDFPRTHRPPADAALVVPSYLERGYPYATEDDRQLVATSLGQAYVSAREADLPVALQREEDGISADASLYVLPSTRQILAPTWHRLREYVASGSTLYLSYCSGTNGRTRGPWFQDLNGMFGVEHQLAYGLTNPITPDHFTFTFQSDFGSIAAGEQLRFTTGGNSDSRAFLPVIPAGAEVVATDDDGNPALLRHRVGAGETILCTYPLEHMAFTLPGVNPEPSYRIYDALAEIADITRDVVVADPRIFTDELHHEDGRRFRWFVSQHPEPVTFRPTVRDNLPLRTLDGSPVAELTLAPYGVAVLALC